MSEVERIHDQLRRSYEGTAWSGPSLRKILEGVTAAQAAASPVASVHSIWELVHHIAAWEDIARRRIEGERVDTEDIPMEENFPPVEDTSDAAWEASLAHLDAVHHRLRDAITRLTDADLERRIPGTRYTIYFLLHGVIQHDLYHAGQIALLKK